VKGSLSPILALPVSTFNPIID